jgi:hypothetical protein
MSHLKDQLIKLGSKDPSLRKHVRPVLDRISSRRKRAGGPNEGSMFMKRFEEGEIPVNADYRYLPENAYIRDEDQGGEVVAFVDYLSSTAYGLVSPKADSELKRSMNNEAPFPVAEGPPKRAVPIDESYSQSPDTMISMMESAVDHRIENDMDSYDGCIDVRFNTSNLEHLPTGIGFEGHSGFAPGNGPTMEVFVYAEAGMNFLTKNLGVLPVMPDFKDVVKRFSRYTDTLVKEGVSFDDADRIEDILDRLF